MDGNNRFGARGDGLLQAGRVHRISMLFDIDEHRRCTAITDGLCRSHKGAWDRNYLVPGADAQRQQSEPQRVGAVADATRIFGAAERSEFLLEFFNERATREGARIYDGV